MEKENVMSMQSKQILPPTIGLDRRSGSAASSTGGAGGRQHKLKQRFTVIRKLGKGTYGKVQLAVNKETGQEVAIKTIKKTKIENEQDLERVRREIQIMSSIEHPHIIHIYEVFENKDKIVLIMQYAPGGELYEYVSQSKVLDEVEARRLFRQVATAIYYCHKNKICHRDLKLENILLDEKNNAKLADFGLSNVFDKSRQLKTFCGSPLYASPEIVQGSPYEGPEVDCWSLGVLLYTLVYGAMPFDGSNFKRLVKQISEACYYEPKQRSQASPLISKLLCADPLKRATIFDICQDPWVNGHQSLVPPSLPANADGPQQRPASPSSPNGQQRQQQQQQQQAQTSLLKVAQDMANLTPVRLDILLALTPAATAASADAKLAHASKQVLPNERAAKRKASLVDQELMKASRQQQQQQQQQDRQAELMDQLDGPSLMEVDENRATSPVASYRVRDLAAESETRPEEETVAASQTEEVAVEPKMVGAQQEDLQEPPQNNFQEPRQTDAGNKIIGQADTFVREEEEEVKQNDSQPRATEQPEEGRMVIEEQICDEELLESVPDIELADATSPQEPEIVENEPANEGTSEKQIEKEIEALERTQTEVVASSADTAAPPEKPEESTESLAALDALAVGVESPQAAEQPNIEQSKANEVDRIAPEEAVSKIPETAPEEAKPKKVKKKIIVVKKKKKVAKKEAAGQQEGTDRAEAKDKEKGDEQQPSEATANAKKGSLSSGPGKVRIPDTFQPTGEPTTPTSTLSRASRRQSALIADVSQKLLQQQQHPANSAPIEEDQKQLASVRVSDKKSEFERRASLASSSGQQQPRADSISPRGSQDVAACATGELDESPSAAKRAAYEPDPAESRLEAKREIDWIAHTILEPVSRLEPLTTEHLKPISSAQEPLTPTAANSVTGSLSQALSDRAEGTDSSLATSANEDRSDSVETIKAEIEPGFQAERLSPRQTSVRSSLQINLGPAREQLEQASAKRRSSGSVAGSSAVAGPAPIARSYKKVTFTKDGSCVTETGRIYSTQADDGTMRRIERKSKVTHYLSESAAGSSGPSAEASSAVEETREEIVYEDGGGSGGAGFRPSDLQGQASSLQRDRPLERLIMPSSDYFEGQCDESAGGSSRLSMERMDSASSCSSGSTDVFDDIFDTWTGAISMFSKRGNRRLSGIRDSLMARAFASATPSSARQQSHAQAGSSLFKHHVSSSLAGTPQERCGSVEPPPPPRSHFDGASEGFPRMRKHHHHHRHHRNRHPNSASDRSSLDASGYESDVPTRADFRPASAGARGVFGSSNLAGVLPRHFPSGVTESLGAAGLEDDLFEGLNHSAVLDPFGGSLLMQEIQLEQAKMRRRMAQQRKQLWKSSTPALNEIPGDHASPVCIEQRFVRSRADSSSSGSQAAKQARRVVTTVYETLQQASPAAGGQQLNQSQSSGGIRQQQQRSIRQSAPLESAPTRRNTANLSDHLPPRQPVSSVRRSTSKTGSLTSQMANMRIGADTLQSPSGLDGSQRQRHISASFIELKRNSTSSASSNQHLNGAPRQDPVAGSSSAASSSIFCEAPQTPSTCPSNLSNSRIAQQMAAGAGQPESEVNSRIQSWLQQSSGNLSISSGSKSSDTLPSSGRSDGGSMLRRDESMGTTVTNSSMFSNQRRQRRLETSHQMHQTHHQLPPIAGKLLSSSRQSLVLSQAPQAASSAASMTIRSSSSEQSVGPGGQRVAACGPVEQRHRAEEKIVIGGGVTEIEDSSEMFARQTSSSNTAQVSSHSSTLRFAFPGDESGEQEVFSEKQVITKRRQQVFTHRVMTPQMMSSNADLPWFQQQMSSSGLRQSLIDDGFNDDFDSLVGSGADLDSISSSSLLDQLRARGYRSMINQRMVNKQQQEQQQQQVSRQSTDSNVITSSSTSITMSSSGVGGASQPEEERSGRVTSSREAGQQQQQRQAAAAAAAAANEFVAQLIVTDQQQAQLHRQNHENQQQQQQVKLAQEEASLAQRGSAAEMPPQPLNEPANENGSSTNGHSVSGACAAPTGCELGAQQAAVGANSNRSNEESAGAEDEDVREAKANIKGYVDRMREMESFLKSMHEEEERFQKQRQDMFLFNNLLLSAKLNGLKSQKNSFEPTESCFQAAVGAQTSSRGHSSAPISCTGYSASNGFLASVRSHLDEASSGVDALHSQPPASLAAQMPCFSSDLYKPSISHLAAAGPRARSPLPSEDYAHDPLLEPVQPLQLSHYQPIAAASRSTRRRSKSQLSDQFAHYTPAHSTPTSRALGGLGLSNFPTATTTATSATTRRSLSANIDSLAGLTSSPYFPSRQRRSVSQMRHSTVVPPASSYQDNCMMSEYKSSFGPNLRARSPLRARATSPRLRATLRTSGGDKSEPENGSETCAGREDDSDEHDDMRDYRASNYVPKVVPDCVPIARRARSLSRRSSTLDIGASGSGFTSKLSTLPSSARETDSELGSFSERRKSMQATVSSQLGADSSERERSASPAAVSRRRSLGNSATGANERAQGASLPSLDNSRLSELEQRIQANKRRRQELLLGINSAPAKETAAPSSGLSARKTSDASNEQQDGDLDSFGLERASRPGGRCNAETAATSSRLAGNSAGGGGSSSPRSRPSRLESMEARIKRRSYCVRVTSPDRTRAKSLRPAAGGAE